MSKLHTYNAKIQWTGNNGSGTSGYTAYSRSHTVSIHQKQDLLCSSDPIFRGDNTKHNPEDLFLTSIASCHMLWFLHLCADEGIIVVDYFDNAEGVMHISDTGGGFFKEVTLYPNVTIIDGSMIEKANSLHRLANQKCFIANSCNFTIRHQPTCQSQDA